MSGLGALWGFIKSKLGSAAFRDVGTSAGNVVALNGSAQLPAVDGSLLTGVGSGGAGVESYTEVATLAALQSALANGARLLVTADIAMGTTDTIDLTSITSLTIAIRDGKKISHSGTADIFSASSGTCRLTLETGPRTASTPAFEVTGSGKIANSSGTLILDWSKRLHIDGPTGAWTPFGTGVKIDGGDLTIDAGNGLITLGYGYGKIRSLLANGGGSSCAVLLRVGCGPVVFRGEFRSYNLSSISATYSLSVQSPFSSALISAGPVQFDMTSQTYTPGVYAIGIVDVFGINSTSSSQSYRPRVALGSSAVCRASRIVPVAINTTGPGSFHQCYIHSNGRESSGRFGGFVSCDFSGGAVFGSSTKPTIAGGCVVSGAEIIFESGSRPIVDHMNVIGTLTIDSGAGGRFTGLQDGGGTFTNNDALSTVTLCENVTWDTTPATRRWQTSAGAALPDLDAFSRKYLAAYFDFAEAPDPMPNKAPNDAPTPGFCTFDAAASSAGIDGKGLDLDTNDESFRFNPTGIPRSTALDAGSMPDWSFRFAYKPTASPPTASQIVANLSDGASGPGEFDLNHLITSGFLGFWNGSSNVNGTTALVAGTTYDIIIQKRLVSGTPTYEVYLDNVLEISTTTNANVAVPVNATFGLGRYATGGNGSGVGVYSSLAHFLAAIPSARRAELAAGAVLVGADL